LRLQELAAAAAPSYLFFICPHHLIRKTRLNLATLCALG